jgi:hypothetical protein
MTMTLRKTATGLVAGVLTMAAATPALAANTGTPPGPPRFSGDPGFTGEYTGQGALVGHCGNEGFGSGVPGVVVINHNGTLFNTPRGFC